MARRNLAVRLASFVVVFPITLMVILFAVSNLHAVPIQLWPIPGQLEISLSLVVLPALGLGLLIGEVIAWAGNSGTSAAPIGRRSGPRIWSARSP